MLHESSIDSLHKAIKAGDITCLGLIQAYLKRIEAFNGPCAVPGPDPRTLLPGYAFDPRTRKHGLPKPLLTGRTGRLILTSDTPGWAFWLMYARALKHQVQRQILSYVGIKPQGFTHFSPVEHSTDQIRAGWLAQTRALGQSAA